MYVDGVHNLFFNATQRGRRNGISAESQKLKKARDDSNPTRKHDYGTIVERYLEDGQ